jgi:Uma2 family endonuclease
MELLVENVVEERELSDYEIERNKPLPDIKHSIVQTNLLFKLGNIYGNDFSILPELNITMPTGRDAVPDICIYPKIKIDFSNDIESMIEMPLTTIEIISPPQTEEQLLRNVERYFDAGVQSCWIVLPISKTIVVFSDPINYQTFTIANPILKDTILDVELDLNKVFA